MIRINKNTRTLILAMGVLVIIGILISKSYYGRQNAHVDPRIVDARKLYEKYNDYAKNSQMDSVFFLMDTIESIYSQFRHYRNSYETGVLYNNRAASWLTIAFYSELRDSIERDSLVFLAEKAVRKSLDIYSGWKDQYEGLESPEAMEKIIGKEFLDGLENYSEEEQNSFLDARISEIIDAKTEIDRRQSVSLTNLGMVYRYHEKYDSAVFCYEEALKLWERNLSAENNMNLLLGRPARKRGLIERLFPPARL